MRLECEYGNLSATTSTACFVRADISRDGKALLKGSTGDNGRMDAGREWSLDPGQVDNLFDARLIRRSDARRIDIRTSFGHEQDH